MEQDPFSQPLSSRERRIIFRIYTNQQPEITHTEEAIEINQFHYYPTDNQRKPGACLWDILRRTGITEENLKTAARNANLVVDQYVDNTEQIVRLFIQLNAFYSIGYTLHVYNYEARAYQFDQYNNLSAQTVLDLAVLAGNGPAHYVEAREHLPFVQLAPMLQPVQGVQYRPLGAGRFKIIQGTNRIGGTLYCTGLCILNCFIVAFMSRGKEVGVKPNLKLIDSYNFWYLMGLGYKKAIVSYVKPSYPTWQFIKYMLDDENSKLREIGRRITEEFLKSLPEKVIQDKNDIKKINTEMQKEIIPNVVNKQFSLMDMKSLFGETNPTSAIKITGLSHFKTLLINSKQTIVLFFGSYKPGQNHCLLVDQITIDNLYLWNPSGGKIEVMDWGWPFKYRDKSLLIIIEIPI